MNLTPNKLAITVLALSLTQAVNASENNFAEEATHDSTYWGVGIGSVLGAVIAGPPGAAIGATLGGSIGWGKDQTDALDDSLTAREQQALKLQKHSQSLAEQQQTLTHAKQEVMALKRANNQQASRLNELEAIQNTYSQDSEFLKNLSRHYAQDIYFQSGQFETPDYAKSRLANLVELLKTHPDLMVTLKGFTDSKGSKTLNEKLAQARVDSIKEALAEQGIDESRVTGLAVGEVEHNQPRNMNENDSTLIEIDLADNKPAVITSQPHVLDRRVSIELNVVEQNIADEPESADIGSLAILEP